mmetsp:Transcript_25057/g.70300  ORF Transcript_25057/g.70300 Transcript_25057/m.70300 type:complete len:372 (-) Transcript_25057:965-2080(-)
MIQRNVLFQLSFPIFEDVSQQIPLFGRSTVDPQHPLHVNSGDDGAEILLVGAFCQWQLIQRRMGVQIALAAHEAQQIQRTFVLVAVMHAGVIDDDVILVQLDARCSVIVAIAVPSAHLEQALDDLVFGHAPQFLVERIVHIDDALSSPLVDVMSIQPKEEVLSRFQRRIAIECNQRCDGIVQLQVRLRVGACSADWEAVDQEMGVGMSQNIHHHRRRSVGRLVLVHSLMKVEAFAEDTQCRLDVLGRVADHEVEALAVVTRDGIAFCALAVGAMRLCDDDVGDHGGVDVAGVRVSATLIAGKVFQLVNVQPAVLVGHDVVQPFLVRHHATDAFVDSHPFLDLRDGTAHDAFLDEYPITRGEDVRIQAVAGG